MAAFLSLTLNCSGYPFFSILNAAQTPTSVVARNTSRARIQSRARYNHSRSVAWASQLDEFEPRFSPIVNKIDQEPEAEDEVDNVGVKAALSMLKFYKKEISPLLPKSCRYVPTCSEYSMIAYKKYGVVKGTVLTAWRLCRCNPLGGSGFDPPRWFDEEPTADE
uniref:Membrane protein insertion efficiency factor n=2 Tax=Opuntia streptacantha TaxID=393608 RepID=A0A7C8YUH6_OPUST